MVRTVEMTTDLNPRDTFFMNFTVLELLGCGMGVGFGILFFDQGYLPMWIRAIVGLLIPAVIISLISVHVRGHSLAAWSNLLLEHFMWPRKSVWTPEQEEAPFVATDDEVSKLMARLGGTTAPATVISHASVKKVAKRKTGMAKTQLLPLVPDSISDRMVTMPNGHRCGVLECTGRNLPMLAEEEHEMWDSRYHRFLLSLKHPIKIIRRIRPAKISPYLEQRRQRARKLPNATLRAIERYDISFMESLATSTNGAGATNPRTFVVIPAPEEVAETAHKTSTLSIVRGADSKAQKPTHAQAVSALDARCTAIADQLYKLGIYARRLNEEELAEMWHETLRPRSSSIQPLSSDALAETHSSIGEIRHGGTAAPTFVV